MAYGLIAHTAAQSPDSGSFTTPSIDTTGATLIVLWLLSYSGVGRPTVSDSAGNTWTALTDHVDSSVSRGTFFYCQSPSTSASHTFSSTGATQFGSLYVEAWSGSTSSPFDQQNGGAGTGATLQPGSVTPSVDNELVVTGVGNYQIAETSYSIDSGFTITDQFTPTGNSISGGMAYLVQTTATAENPTWSYPVAVATVAAIATFKAGGAPPSVLSPWWYYGSQGIGGQ